jgi:hypothetical protein
MTVSRRLLKCIMGRTRQTKGAKVSPKSELAVSKFPDERDRVLDVSKISIFVAGYDLRCLTLFFLSF